jgi:hypothetical protein
VWAWARESARAATSEIEELGRDVLAMDPLVLIEAIRDTIPKQFTFQTKPGIKALRWVETNESRPRVREVLLEVLREMDPR